MDIVFEGLDSAAVARLRQGGADANGQAPERAVSDGAGTPCRHCLRDVPAGQGMLILAWRPFSKRHPYAELGPIFLCAEACDSGSGPDLPAILTTSPDYLVKGYGPDERIVYGTGGIIPRDGVAARCAALLEDPAIAFVDIRSARNNCFLTRVRRPSTR